MVLRPSLHQTGVALSGTLSRSEAMLIGGMKLVLPHPGRMEPALPVHRDAPGGSAQRSGGPYLSPLRYGFISACG